MIYHQLILCIWTAKHIACTHTHGMWLYTWQLIHCSTNTHTHRQDRWLWRRQWWCIDCIIAHMDLERGMQTLLRTTLTMSTPNHLCIIMHFATFNSTESLDISVSIRTPDDFFLYKRQWEVFYVNYNMLE